jgi:hypothetical protein
MKLRYSNRKLLISLFAVALALFLFWWCFIAENPHSFVTYIRTFKLTIPEDDKSPSANKDLWEVQLLSIDYPNRKATVRIFKDQTWQIQEVGEMEGIKGLDGGVICIKPDYIKISFLEPGPGRGRPLYDLFNFFYW